MEIAISSLQGKRAFITRASRGIGAANAIGKEIEAAGGRAVAIQMNAADPASIKQAVDRAASELGGLIS